MTVGARACVRVSFCASECCTRCVDPFAALSEVFFMVGEQMGQMYNVGGPGLLSTAAFLLFWLL